MSRRRIGDKQRHQLVLGWGLLVAGLVVLHGYYVGGGRSQPPGAGALLPW